MITQLISKYLPKRRSASDELPTEWPQTDFPAVPVHEAPAAPSWQELVPTDVGQISRKGMIFVFGFYLFMILLVVVIGHKVIIIDLIDHSSRILWLFIVINSVFIFIPTLTFEAFFV